MVQIACRTFGAPLSNAFNSPGLTAGPTFLPALRASIASEKIQIPQSRDELGRGPKARQQVATPVRAWFAISDEFERRRRGTFPQEFVDQLVPCDVIPDVAGKSLCVNLHLVWSTKQRRSLIDRQWRDRLHAYIAMVVQSRSARVIEAQSQPDHIHLYISMPSTTSIAHLVNVTKTNSSRWIRETFANRRLFGWQDGYAAFSVSKSMEKVVIDYIRNQDEHHRRRDFQQELVELLQRHAINFDSRYIFD